MMESRRILVLSRKDIHHPKAGGAEIVLQKYLQGLVSQGHNVTQIAPLFPGAAVYESIEEVQVKRMFSIHTIYFLFWIRYVRHAQGKYDVIIDHAGGIPLLSPLYARKKKIIFFIHHLGTQEWHDYFQQHRGMGWLGKVFLQIYNLAVLRLYRHKLTITVSQGTANELHARGFNAVTVIPNTTDMPLIPLGKIATKENVLTIIGRIIPNKQMHHAIEVLRTLSVQDPTWKLNIIGYAQDMNTYAMLQALVAQYGLQNAVLFHGKLGQEEIISVLDDTKYLLITSDKEGFGLTAIEANKRGVPVIAYAIPGVDEVVQHGITGYLVPKNDIQAIVKAIRELASTYSTLVTSTHAYIASYPTWSKNCDTFASVLFS